jgi:hypothetical protein
MSSKAHHIASGGGNIEDLTSCAILRCLDVHYLLKLMANDIQLWQQLSTMWYQDMQSIKIFTNKIQTLAN